MSRIDCIHEQHVVEAVCSGLWPDRCDDDLRTHVSECEVCRDVVAVAQTLRSDSDVALQNVQVPSAGLVWWRSELRARREAVRSAERPIGLVHAFAGACAVGVLFALISRMSPWFGQVLSSAAGLYEVSAVIFQQHLPLVLLVGVLLVLAPVALYFVFSDE